MSRRFIVALAALVWVAVGSPPVKAAPFIDPFEIEFNVDGTVTPGDTSGLVNGLGAFSFTVTGVGLHFVAGFFDYEIDEPTNTFFNEVGSAVGISAAGQSWEIDEPGYVFGDIYTHFATGTLDKTVGTANPDDVSVALRWDILLAADEMAVVTFTITDQAPASGFYLQHADPDSQTSIYFASNATIRPIGVPEPAALLLLGTGLICLGARARSHR